MGRPAIVPPAGRGKGLDARPCRGAGGKGGAAGSEIGALPWGRWVRWGWTERTRSLPGGGRPRVGDAGLGDPAFRVTLRVGGAL